MALTLRVTRHNKITVTPPIVARFGASGGSIGRSPANDLCLPDPDRWVSSRHAELRYRGGDYYVVDISTNGTLLNAADKRLERGAEVRLANGDTIGICGYEIQVAIDNQAVPAQARPAVSARAAGLGGATIIERRAGASTLPPAQIPRPANRPPSRPQHPPAQPPAAPQARPPQHRASPPLAEQTRMITRAELIRAMPALSDDGRSSAPAADGQTLLNAFFAGLGCKIPTSNADEQQRMLRHAGDLLRTLANGLVEVLKVRSNFKSELRLEMTTIQSSENNPFKFSLDLEQTLVRILAEPEGSAVMLPPVEAARSACADINDHQQAVIHGLRTLLRSVLQELNPKQIEQETPRSGAIEERLNPAAQKARAWELYVETFDRLYEEIREDALRRFDRAFADGYESYTRQRRRERGIVGNRRGGRG